MISTVETYRIEYSKKNKKTCDFRIARLAIVWCKKAVKDFGHGLTAPHWDDARTLSSRPIMNFPPASEVNYAHAQRSVAV